MNKRRAVGVVKYDANLVLQVLPPARSCQDAHDILPICFNNIWKCMHNMSDGYKKAPSKAKESVRRMLARDGVEVRTAQVEGE